MVNIKRTAFRAGHAHLIIYITCILSNINIKLLLLLLLILLLLLVLLLLLGSDGWTL